MGPKYPSPCDRATRALSKISFSDPPHSRSGVGVRMQRAAEHTMEHVLGIGVEGWFRLGTSSLDPGPWNEYLQRVEEYRWQRPGSFNVYLH